ncbi:MAG: AAA family ATPase [Candidatus Omnitrophota bacterium]|nr:AAA family ATPase [Candidatus Omnitrophota bacterium]
MKKVNKIVIYGKGGIGKSMIASNLSMIYARQGLKVLQIGCDPKHDSTIRLLGERQKIRTVMDIVAKKSPVNLTGNDVASLIMKGKNNIDCIECGGPKPGVGCAGRGILLMSEILSDAGVINGGEYDVIVFDILGDVVCGGFAAPLKLNFAEKVFIAISEELASLYAANNIAQAVLHYKNNGIYLGGLILNLRDNNADLKHVSRFAKKLNADILAKIPRSKKITDAEHRNNTAVEAYPSSDVARIFSGLAKDILECKKTSSRKLRYIGEEALGDILYGAR